MNGVCIHSKVGGNKRAIDYSFCEIVSPISNHLDGLHWILSGVILDGSKNLEELDVVLPKYEAGELGEYRLMKPGFLPDCCKWIKGDWDQIFGVRDLGGYRKANDLREANLKKEAEIWFQCVDAAYWEIYSQLNVVVDLLMKQFPNSSACSPHS